MKNVLKFFLLISLVLIPSLGFSQNPHIVGKTTSQEVREQHGVFDIYTKRYSPHTPSVTYLSEIKDSVQIYVLFGTWCHDSKKQVPAFIKTLEEANNPLIKVEYIALTKSKTDPEDEYKRWGLKLTPTFVIYRNGIELGRIIEEPKAKLEQDLVTILQSES